MRRRDFTAAVAGAFVASPRLVVAQKRVPRLVCLWLGPAGSDSMASKGLHAGLRETGFQEGRDIVVDFRYADGQEDRLKELAAAAVAEQPDLILAAGTVVTRSVAKLTQTVPVVSVTGDPVGSGLIASLARPGGNITGLSIQSDIAGKWLDLLFEIVPSAKRIAMLRNAANPVSARELTLMRAATERRAGNVVFDEYAIRDAGEMPAVLATIRAAKLDALVVDNDPLILSKALDIAALDLPAVTGNREFADAGILITYGASILDVFRRVGGYVDRILKGAKPGDLPVQQPTKFELVINLKTAKELGLTVPQALLARADEVIE